MAAGPPDRPPDVKLAFGHEPDAPRRARREIRRLVADPDDPIAEAVVLTASELVTNTLRHTEDGGEMRAWDPQPDVPLRLEVEDHDSTIPTAQTNPDPDRPGGRGLKIVEDVADEWGVHPTDTGKVVWAEFDRNQHTPDDRPH
jgi:anti-sigma regulatory factor (Ser/Thr protein kinase)